MENSKMQEIYRYIDAQAENMQDLLVELASIESPSSCKEGVDLVCERIKEFCDKLEMHTKIYQYEKAGNSFTAVMNENSDKKKIALMGHMDTVHPIGSFETPIIKKDAEFIYGPGVYDCKGGLVIAMFVCKTLHKFGYSARPIKLIFSGDEEIGHRNSEGSEIFIEDAANLALALNCESGLLDGRVIVGRKGGAGMKLIIEGVAAHSGNAPEKGRSAIREAAYKVIEIEKHTDFNNTTYSCGLIKGGTVANQIPDHCEITVDIRVKNQKAAEEAKKVMQSIADTTYVEGTKTTLIAPTKNALPMEDNERNREVFRLFEEASRKVGAILPVPYFSGGGSDAALTSAAGVPSLCGLGIRGMDNHSKKERALLASLPERVKVLTTLIMDYDLNCLE